MDKKLSKKIKDHLNQILASTIDLKLQAKQAHWNIKGQNFMELHILFDNIATDADLYADAFAERIVQLDGIACGTVHDVAKASTLKPLHKVPKEFIKALTAAVDAVNVLSSKIILLAASSNDSVTADLATRMLAAMDKWRWFLVAHI